MAESKGRNHNYEAMFLISERKADLATGVEHIKHLFGRANVETIAMSKWDERRLAFEIDKQKRGIYVLAYFSADPVSIVGLERDANLSEIIMRFMILRADHLTVEEMQATDARTELETEIKLRSDEAAKAEAAKPESAAASA